MRPVGSSIELSASDLSWFLSCKHRTALDMAVARGQRAKPTWSDPILAALRERGLDHEHSYVESLGADGVATVELSGLSTDDAITESLKAMRAGAAAIVQPALRDGGWFGTPDVLRRVETGSLLGPWSYEAVDTKLARETRGTTVLQLSLYSELVRRVQGRAPEYFHVITPDLAHPVTSFRVDNYGAYFRLLLARLAVTSLEDAETVAMANYPEPIEGCDVCHWRIDCDKRRRKDDHLSLVAGISRLQTRELQAAGVETLAALGGLPLPLTLKPRRGAVETFVRIREQARIQLAGRMEGRPVHEVLPIAPDHGFCHLPPPSAGDIFLDLEGDPFAREGGREYLFGLLWIGAGGATAYQRYWAATDAEEKVAFEAAMDAILSAWSADPSMHVYHYGHYETAAIKRLMGRYATRESDVDQMLRAGLFVDLHAVVKRSLRASVEKYSIKDLEKFYGFTRSVPLDSASVNLRVVERAIELGDRKAITPDVSAAVEGYNRDDCASTWALQKWLEELRAAEETKGVSIPRPIADEAEPSEDVSDRERRARELSEALLVGVPIDKKERDAEQDARWLLANLIGWHRREEKAPWWEFFRLCDLTESELFDERAALAGLEFKKRIGGTKKCPIDRFSYPFQETDIERTNDLRLSDGTIFGKVEAINRVGRTIDIKKREKHAGSYPPAVFEFTIVLAREVEESILRLAEDVIVNGMAGSRNRAGRRLLLADPPVLKSGAFARRNGEAGGDFARRIADDLDGTVLAIQGPPGSGKTFNGAAMICDLVAAGRRVGVTAVSHKIIRNLLNAVLVGAKERTTQVSCSQKVKEKPEVPGAVLELTSNEAALGTLQDGTAQVLGGTAWLWSRPDAADTVDVLFIDEAGQMSLANALAVAQAGRSIVLLGDPQQLEQPVKGSHPDGTCVSALEHIIQGHPTIPEDRGIFLAETWRLAPKICDFTSEVFYESKLHPREGLERQTLTGTAMFEGSGLWTVPIPHEGNQNSSLEEVAVVERIVSALLAEGASWVDEDGKTKPMTPADILVVAPYNAQVARLEEKLQPRGIKSGTVDRFQGQEAPVVIYSMASSSPEDAPRGMEFLYSLNRLNVATSRARCACILVANPRLFEPECKTPRQMQLANALCRYVELAKPVSI